MGTLGAVLVAVSVAVVEAIRARRARAERDEVTKRQAELEHRAAASVVSTWVEEAFIPNEDTSAYIRHAVVNISNEGTEPVFNLTSLIGVRDDAGQDVRAIGPLSVPTPIPVLPPRRQLSWDITIPLFAHGDVVSPCATVAFSDPNGNRWVRDFDGSLKETTGQDARLFDASDENAEEAIKQLGTISDAYNPMAVALLFLSCCTADETDFDLASFQSTLAPEAPGWSNLTAESISTLREELTDYGLGSFATYPAPFVAYIKIIHEQDKDLQLVAGEGLVMHVKILTMTFNFERGWRVFGYGPPIPPNRILFPSGTLA